MNEASSIVRSFAFTLLVSFLGLGVSACERHRPGGADGSGDAAAASGFVAPRILRSDSVAEGEEADEGVEVDIMWPVEREIDLRKLGPGAIAGEIFSDPPDWCEYQGAGQNSVEADGKKRVFNFIGVHLVADDALDRLVEYCTDHGHDRAIIVLYRMGDEGMFMFNYEEAERMLESSP